MYQVVFGDHLALSMECGNEDCNRILSSYLLDHLFSAKIPNGPLRNGTYFVRFINSIYMICFVGSSKEFILKKFLLLVLYLDQAKLTRLIDCDPCLFRKTSKIKV